MIESVINLKSPNVQTNPHPFYRKLLKNKVCRVDPGNIWAITHYDDVLYALKHHEIFSSSGFGAMLQPDWLKVNCYRGGFLILEDPPDHTKHRSLITKAFVTSAIEALTPLMKNTAERLVSTINENQPIELLNQLSYPYIGTIVSELTGIGHGEIPEFLLTCAKLIEVMPVTLPEQEYIDRLETSISQQNAYFEKVVQDKKENPKKELMSLLINSELMPHDLLLQAMALFISAGYQTSVHMLSNAIVQLSNHPDIAASLAESPEKIPQFIEESMRLSPNSHGFLRKTTEDVTFNGVTIPRNSIVYLIAAAANTK